jgi:CheY-like chemotaxis protein/HPt (histidine-containing phosphotransfer) domain-containing protein
MSSPRIPLPRPSRKQALRIERRRQRLGISMSANADAMLDELQHLINTQLNGIAGMLEMMLHTDLDAEQRAMLALAQDTAEKLLTESTRLLQRKPTEAERATSAQQMSASIRTMLISASAAPSPALQELQRLGIGIDHFADTKTALAALSRAAHGERPYRVVLVEQLLQGVNGETLGTAIGSDITHRDTLLVLLSDTHSAQDADRLAEAGFSAWLPQRAPATMLHDTLNTLYRWIAGKAAPGFIAAGMVIEDDGDLSANALPFDGRRILAVDDNPVNLHVIERMLARLGCQVDTAAGGKLALNRAADHAYDLILMDCHMTDLDGHQTTALLRAAEAGSRHTPIIGWSACTRRNERDTCLATGMDDFLPKPTHPRALRQLLARWLPAAQTAKADTVEAEDELETTQQMFGTDFAELAQLFLADTPQRIAALRAAIEAQDSLAFAKVTHALCGSSASIGATLLAALCRELEIRARNGIVADVARMQSVEREYARIEDKLHALMRSGIAEPAARRERH